MNRLSQKAIIISSNLNGFSLANHRKFAKLSPTKLPSIRYTLIAIYMLDANCSYSLTFLLLSITEKLKHLLINNTQVLSLKKNPILKVLQLRLVNNNYLKCLLSEQLLLIKCHLGYVQLHHLLIESIIVAILILYTEIDFLEAGQSFNLVFATQKQSHSSFFSNKMCSLVILSVFARSFM